jgi:hypothetical protein
MGEHSTSNRLAVDQPTRGADRNRSLADQVNPATLEQEERLDDHEERLTELEQLAFESWGRGTAIVRRM